MALTNDGLTISMIAKIRQFKTELGSGAEAGSLSEILSYIESYEPGNGQNRVDRVYGAHVAALSQTDLDLQGSLTGPFGDTISFPIVMGLIVKNLSRTSGQNVLVGGGTNPWLTHLGAGGDIVKIGPQGMLFLWSPLDGYATTAGTGDILRLDPSSGTPEVAYLILGRSA